jgi:hypothetical protein
VAHWSISSVLTGACAPGAGKAMFARGRLCLSWRHGVGNIRPISRMFGQGDPAPCCFASGSPLRWCGTQRAVTHRFSQVSGMFNYSAASRRS